jgi:hypothetical protein
MELTDEERRYLACLAREMTFEKMAVELGWTGEEVEDFGNRFFERAFEERKRPIQ